MPAIQIANRCCCCFDWGLETFRKLSDCGHVICDKCYEEQVGNNQQGKSVQKKRKKVTCVMQNHEDWYNIDIVQETGANAVTTIAEGGPERSVTAVVGGGLSEDGEIHGEVGKRLMLGCRTCQNRVFKVRDPDKLKAMPIMGDMGLVEDATRAKPCETDQGHDSIVPDAKYWCMGCDKYICKECKQRFHRMMGTIDGEFKDCNVFSLDVISGKKEIGPDLFLRQLSGYTGCGQHNGAEQTHFCLRCKRLACCYCLLDSSSHAGHPGAVEELRYAVNHIKKQTQADVDKLTILYCRIEKQKRAIGAKKEEKIKQFEKMEADVEKYAAELCARIEKVKQAAKDKIDKDRERCLYEIHEYENELETVKMGVWTFGEAVHKILDVGHQTGDVQSNQVVLVQKHLSSNRKAFDGLSVPDESISLKRMLSEACQFKQNVSFLERIVPETLGHFAAERRETFLIHEYNMTKDKQKKQTGVVKKDKRRKSADIVMSSPSIAVMDNSRFIITDRATDTGRLVRSSPDVMAYRDGVTFPMKEPVGLASLGYGFILVLRSRNKLVLATNSGHTYPLPNCGPKEKYEICSLACVGETVYFGCYDPNTSAGRGVICSQDYQYSFSALPGEAPFVFSLCMEYCRIRDSLRPHCLAVRMKRSGLQMVIGQPPQGVLFIMNRSSVLKTLEGGDAFRVMDVCYDRDGDVLVADGHNVLLYGADGALKGIVAGEDEGVKRPVAIAVMDKNELIIGDEEIGIITFVYRKMALRQVEFRCKV
jgi:hypothetical protein